MRLDYNQLKGCKTDNMHKIENLKIENNILAKIFLKLFIFLYY